MINSISSVVGVGYGDEGKGRTVQDICLKTRNPVVIRFGGGNQVGHTTLFEGCLHVHHHTGSGSLVGTPTFYSRFCTVDPIGTLNEMGDLYEKGFTSYNFYDPRCMIVTPADVEYNRLRDNSTGHGSVGVGFGATIGRNEDHCRLMMCDILCKEVFIEKCWEIQHYYSISDFPPKEFDEEKFYDSCKEFYKNVKCGKLTDFISRRDFNIEEEDGLIEWGYDLIFEGHQGTLLDMEYGVFPHVTRSKTTPKNIFTILREEGIGRGDLNTLDPNITHHFVTRTYHTRHGNGPFHEKDIELVNTEHETNKSDGFQGPFKKAPLDMDLLMRGIHNAYIDIDKSDFERNDIMLTVTCCDQVSNSASLIEKIKEEVRASDLLNGFVGLKTFHGP